MATQPRQNGDHEELVEVFDTMDESEAMVVKGLLESSGIPALISGLDAPQDILPGVGGLIVRVPHERGEEARMLIENRDTRPPRRPGPTPDAT